MKEEFDLKLSSYFGKNINVEIIESLSCECDKLLKKQLGEVREWVAIHKEVICEYSTNYFLKAFDENFLKQEGGKGIKPKGK